MIEEDRQSTLSIDLEGQEKSATMALYRVGEWDGSQGTYVLAEEFSGVTAQPDRTLRQWSKTDSRGGSDLAESIAQPQKK